MTEQPPPYGPPHQPPYGVPSGYPPGQPPLARRYRPSAWWFGLGIALILSAVVAGIGLFVWTLGSFLSTDARVPADGQAHVVDVPDDGDRMIWTDESVRTPTCTVVDRASGREISLRPVSGEFRRSHGSVGDWLGSWRFDPGSGDLEVTCSDSSSTPKEAVEIGPAPGIAGFLGGIAAAIIVPLLLGLSGTVVLIVTGILWSVRPARPTTSG